MYRLSNNRTEWYGSTTPLVKVENGKEEQILFTPLTKKLGEPFLEKVATFLNDEKLILKFLDNKEKIINFLEEEENN